MHFLKWGNGKKQIVCLHGWPGEGSKWAELASHLVRENSMIWALDLPGWGDSEIEFEMKLEDYANELKKFIEENEINKPILIGHSFGGKLAIKFTNLYPDDVYKLVLISSSGIIEKNGLSNLVKNFIWRRNHPWINSQDYKKASEIKKNTFEKVVVEDVMKEASTITCPTLLIYGNYDKITPFKIGETFRDVINNSKLEIVEGDHTIAFRNVHQIVPLISMFID